MDTQLGSAISASKTQIPKNPSATTPSSKQLLSASPSSPSLSSNSSIRANLPSTCLCPPISPNPTSKATIASRKSPPASCSATVPDSATGAVTAIPSPSTSLPASASATPVKALFTCSTSSSKLKANR